MSCVERKFPDQEKGINREDREGPSSGETFVLKGIEGIRKVTGWLRPCSAPASLSLTIPSLVYFHCPLNCGTSILHHNCS